MRIYDHLTRMPELNDEDANVLLDVLNDAVLFDVTNTFEYMASLDEPSRDRVSITDMPNLVPPFRTTWMEYRVMPGLASDIARWHYESNVHRVGFLLQTEDLREDPYAKEYADGVMMSQMRQSGKVLSAEPRWMMCERDVLGRGGNIEILPFTRFWFLDDAGSVIKNEKTGQMVNALIPFSNFVHNFSEWGDSDLVQHVNRHTHLAPLFALSLTHCKNVQVVDAPDIRTRQQKRMDARKGMGNVATFRTLQIEPMRRVLRDEGGAEKHGLKKALHICRGHFAHYSESKPLFGKYTGTFWKPAHVRGSAEAGTVYKDYRVKA